jgi:hypothetical protein
VDIQTTADELQRQQKIKMQYHKEKNVRGIQKNVHGSESRTCALGIVNV